MNEYLNNTDSLNIADTVQQLAIAPTETILGSRVVLGLEVECWALILSGLAVIISIIALFLSIKRRRIYIEDIFYQDRKSVKNLADILEMSFRNIKEVRQLRLTLEKLEKQLNAPIQEPAQSLNKSVDTKHSTTSSKTKQHKKENRNNSEISINTMDNSRKEYIWLKVIDGGKLTIVQSPETAIYRAWDSNGVFAFEFSCLRTGKAINNRTSVIDPFCEVNELSVDPDMAKDVFVIQCGKLNKDFSLINKVLIQYK